MTQAGVRPRRFAFMRGISEGEVSGLRSAQLFKKQAGASSLRRASQTPDIVFVDGPNAKANLNSDAKIFIMSATRLRMWWEKILAAHSDIQCLMGDKTHKYWKRMVDKRTNAFYLEFAERVTYLVGINAELNSAYPMIHAIEPRLLWLAFRCSRTTTRSVTCMATSSPGPTPSEW